MATYVLIHAAAVDAWYWGPLAAELRERGHEVVAPDLPCEDEAAGLAEYADAVVAAIGERTGQLVLVAHSFGGFTGPLVCERLPVDLLVMLQAQVPAPGASPGAWWENTGYWADRRESDAARGVAEGAEEDVRSLVVHDTSAALAEEFIAEHQRQQSPAPFGTPWPVDAWPQVPTRFLMSSDDRFFPAAFLRRHVEERLGFRPDEMPGDHCPMLGHPKELAERLEAYRAAL
ncbi:alpha/beta fold hydrolase [Streptomyces sp. LS1784]|uniref:alpha/beta fold hydrolase n=1 Tax=Streptomyces sp. LS1784 TaxID=2851533 RepID=UPI001CCAFD93|nr:alpha/beta hydrolase [Streptomyces sp. LS1784]